MAQEDRAANPRGGVAFSDSIAVTEKRRRMLGSIPDANSYENNVKRSIQMSTTKTKDPPTSHTDAEIARNIRRRMKADFEVPDDQIAVKVLEGSITIEGTVVRDSQKIAAEACAKEVKGVRGIVNKITVEPSASPLEA